MPNIATRHIDFLPSRLATFEGQEYLFFSGTSYLGIGHQADFKTALLEGMNRYGTVFSASRNNNLQLKIYDEAEFFLADWTRAEAALTVTSGLLAGQLAVNLLKNRGITYNRKTIFIYAPSAHPAVWEAPPQYLFQNQADFEANILATIHKEKDNSLVVVANAIDMLRCQHFDFSWITQIPDNQDITLLIDDSHGIGITGENGAGIFQKIRALAQPNIQVIVIASLAKALGIPGGVILSDAKTMVQIRQNPLFVGASPIVPAYLFAFLAAQPMYYEVRKKLISNIELFKNLINKPSDSSSPVNKPKDSSLIIHHTSFNYPVFFTPVNALFDYLFAKKIFISHFAYPKPNDPPITRVVLSALHTKADIEYLAENINQY